METLFATLIVMLLDPVRLFLAGTGGWFSERWWHAVTIGSIAGAIMSAIFASKPTTLVVIHFAVTLALTCSVFAIRQQFRKR